MADQDLYFCEEVGVASSSNLAGFLAWADGAPESERNAVMEQIYLIEHRDPFGPSAPVKVRGSTLRAEPCSMLRCQRCAYGRGGYAFLWLSSRWTRYGWLDLQGRGAAHTCSTCRGPGPWRYIANPAELSVPGYIMQSCEQQDAPSMLDAQSGSFDAQSPDGYDISGPGPRRDGSQGPLTPRARRAVGATTIYDDRLQKQVYDVRSGQWSFQDRSSSSGNTDQTHPSSEG